MSFETKQAAKERHEKELLGEQMTQKNHCGDFQIMHWDKETLKAEVISYEDGQSVNWSELARKYKVDNGKGEIASNGGQIVKEWLKMEGVDVNRFKRIHENSREHIRRKKRRGIGGEITFPVDVSPDKLREMAKEKVQSGEYTLGQRVVPRKVWNY